MNSTRPRLGKLRPRAAAVQLDDRAHEVQAEPDAAVLARVRAVALDEAREDPLEVVGLELLARVGDAQLDRSSPAPLGRARAMRAPRVLNFAAFSSRLSTTCLIRSGSSGARGSSGSSATSSASPASSSRGFRICRHSSHDRAERDRLARERDAARLEVRELEQAVDQLGHARGLALDQTEELRALLRAEPRAARRPPPRRPPRSSFAKPLMLVSGVVSSWLTFARNSDFSRSASAIRSFCARSCSLRSRELALEREAAR